MKKLAKFRYAFLGLTILVCLAALYLFMGFGVRYTKNKPKESNLVGVYKPDLKTRILISKESNFSTTNSEIKLYGGGKIELINVMGWLTEGETNMAEVRLVSTEGNWHLQKVGKYWQIVWDYGNATDYGLRLVREKPPYEIQIYNWQGTYIQCYPKNWM